MNGGVQPTAFGSEVRLGGQGEPMMAVWTQEQDDRAAFEEAMEVADVSLRQLSRGLTKLRREIDSLYEAPSPQSASRHYQQALRVWAEINRIVESPRVARWRQAHSEGRGKRHSQQHILEVKLGFAKELLERHGVDLEAEMAKRRLGS